eukprot:6494218-Alexandrium_andersonii.AAC.1
MLAQHIVLAGDASCKGARYLAVVGGRIPNLGEVELGFATKGVAPLQDQVPSCGSEEAVAG